MKEKFKNFLGIVKNKLIRSEEFKLFIKDKKLKNNNTYFSVDPMPKLTKDALQPTCGADSDCFMSSQGIHTLATPV